MPNLGPLTWFAKYFVKVFTQLIVRDHVQSVVGSITNLYLRRWTSAPKETPDATMLRRSAMQVERVTPGYRGRSLALPTFLLGGAFLSSISSLLSNLVDSGTENTGVLIGLLVALYVVLFALGWCLFRGAAVARTRIKLALDEPLRILWDTVGAAGNPPKDEAMDYAFVRVRHHRRLGDRGAGDRGGGLLPRDRDPSGCQRRSLPSAVRSSASAYSMARGSAYGAS